MKTPVTITHFFRHGVIIICLLLGSLVPAQGASIDSFISIYQKIESYAPANSLPVSSQDLIAAKSLFSCMEDGGDVGICIDTFTNTPLGQQVVSESGLPSSFWSVLDAYVAYKNGDIWGVAYSLGEAAACAVLQALAGGTVDVCDLIKKLVEIAESLWDAATAVAEFFADLGEGAWEAAKDAYCDTLGSVLGGCDDDESSPPEVVAYAWVFAPKLADGLTARKAVSPDTFDLVLQSLIKQASSDPAQLNIQVPQMIADSISFPASAVQTAASIYTNTVDQNWTADILNTVLPALTHQRQDYGTPAKIAQLATTAANAFKNNQAEPAWVVTRQCRDEFKQTLGFAHVDRWISNPSTAIKAQEFKVIPAEKWCGGTFWESNKTEFAKTFTTFARINFCPGAGSPLPCKTIDNYERCRKLMGSVGQEDVCGVNVAAMGKEVAERVKQSLLDQGSKGSYTVIATATGSNNPAKLVCERVPQQNSCNATYQKLFGDYPGKLVSCTVQEKPDYIALRLKVAEAVASLNSGLMSDSAIRKKSALIPAGEPDFVIDPIDPLIVRAKSEAAYNKVVDQNPSFGFGPPSTQPGFVFPLFKQYITLDGLDTPAISNEIEPKKPKPQVHINIKEKIGPGNSIDPIDQVDVQQQMTQNLAPVGLQNRGQLAGAGFAGAATEQKQQQVMSGKLPGDAPGASAPASTVMMKSITTTPLVHKKLPKVETQKKEAVKSLKHTSSPVPSMPSKISTPLALPLSSLPDLTAEPFLTFAAKRTSWSTPLIVDARDASRKANSLCQFPAQFTIYNAGNAPSSSFKTSWRNSAYPGSTVDRSFAAIKAGERSSHTDILSLKTGLNQLRLMIDQSNQVKESTETNNMFQLSVTVNGVCADTLPTTPRIQQRR
jgi:hypothetical protein